MEQTIVVEELEGIIGFPARRLEVTLASPMSYDETLAYELCHRFYGKEEELRKAIRRVTLYLSSVIREQKRHQKEIALIYSTLGNLHYLAGNIEESANCAMRSLSYNREDLAAWAELMFSIRALGEFSLFEDMIFNFDAIVKSWQGSERKTLDKKMLADLAEKAKLIR